jgi:hypothetical protein
VIYSSWPTIVDESERLGCGNDVRLAPSCLLASFVTLLVVLQAALSVSEIV